MSQQQSIFSTAWDGVVGHQGSFALPANLVSTRISFYIQGGSGAAFNGGNSAETGAWVSGDFDPALCPITVVVGAGSTDDAFGAGPTDGGNGFSGGGGGGGEVATTRQAGGGGSTALLTGTTGAYSLLAEAGGGNGGWSYYPGGTLGPPGYIYGGGGGGYATTAVVTYLEVATYAPGGGGASGGNGGNGGDNPSEASNTSNGGKGFGILGSGGNGGNGTTGGVAGAGAGSGGYPNTNAGNSFFDTNRVGSAAYGSGNTSTPSGPGQPGAAGIAIFTYRVADAPSSIDFTSPASGSSADMGAQGVTLAGTYLAPSGDTGGLEAVAVKIVDTTASTTNYWNGGALVAAEAFFTPTTGLLAQNGNPFTVVIPAGVFIDGHVYKVYVRCQEANARLTAAYLNGITLNAVQAATVTITAPTNGSFVQTLTPTISWSDVIPSGSQTNYRVVVYPASVAPTAPPGDVLHNSVGNPRAVWDSFVVAGAGLSTSVPFTWAIPTLPLVSIEGYVVFVQIATTGSVASNWASSSFTVELVDLPTPTLAVIASTEPTSGMPAPKLTMTANDNLLDPVVSTGWGNYVSPHLVNCTISPDLSWSVPPTNFAIDMKAVGNGTMALYLDSIEIAAGQHLAGQAVVGAVGTSRTVSLIVNWYGVSGFLSSSTLASSADISGGASYFGSATAPANTTYAEMYVQVASATAGEIHRVTSAAVNYGTSVPAWGVGVGKLPTSPPVTGAPIVATQETVQFQAQINGVWTDVLTDSGYGPIATIAEGTGTTCVAYDMSAPFGETINYRVRNLVTVSSFSASGVNYPAQTYVSNWATATLTNGVSSTQWWIVPPSAPTTAMGLHRLTVQSTTSSGSTLQSPSMPPTVNGLTPSIAIDRQEQLGAFRPFGKKTATFVHGDMWLDEFDVALYFESTAEYNAFSAIRSLQSEVLLKSDMESQTYWVTIGPDFNAAVYRRADRITNPTRGVVLHCAPTDPPSSGLPDLG